ncbi:hypothetical protein ACFW04_014655 [Cataglyphis niger]
MSHVIRHADFASHKENVLLNNNNITVPKISQKTILNPWLREVSHDASSFFWAFCNISVVSGLSQIYHHAESKKHIIKCKENETNKSSEDINELFLPFEERKKSAEIRYAAAEKLFNVFKIEMWKLNIPFVNIIALSCDNAFVMVGKHLLYKKSWKNFVKINYTSMSLPFYCIKFLKKFATFINSSSKRSAIYQEFCKCFQETNLKILKLSNTRLLESWDIIKLFLNEITISEKKHILNFLNSFNAFFQAVEARIHLLQPKSVAFLTTVCKYFLKSEHLNNLYSNIKFDYNENQKSLEEFFLGTECEEYLNELLKKGHAEIVTNIRKNCLQFYITINDKFLSKLKVFECNLNRGSFNDVSFIAGTLGGFDENGLKKEWLTSHLDFTIIEKKKRMFSILTDVKTKRRNKFSSSFINAICVLKSVLKTRKETILDMEIDEKHLSCNRIYYIILLKNRKAVSNYIMQIIIILLVFQHPMIQHAIIMFKK